MLEVNAQVHSNVLASAVQPAGLFQQFVCQPCLVALVGCGTRIYQRERFEFPLRGCLAISA